MEEIERKIESEEIERNVDSEENEICLMCHQYVECQMITESTKRNGSFIHTRWCFDCYKNMTYQKEYSIEVKKDKLKRSKYFKLLAHDKGKTLKHYSLKNWTYGNIYDKIFKHNLKRFSEKQREFIFDNNNIYKSSIDKIIDKYIHQLKDIHKLNE